MYFRDLETTEVVDQVEIMEVIFIIVEVAVERLCPLMVVDSLDLRDTVNIDNSLLTIIQMQMMTDEMKMV